MRKSLGTHMNESCHAYEYNSPDIGAGKVRPEQQVLFKTFGWVLQLFAFIWIAVLHLYMFIRIGAACVYMFVYMLAVLQLHMLMWIANALQIFKMSSAVTCVHKINCSAAACVYMHSKCTSNLLDKFCSSRTSRRIHMCIWRCLYTYIFCEYTCVHTYECIYMNMRIYVCIDTHARTHARTHINAQIQAHTLLHTHTHTYTHTQHTHTHTHIHIYEHTNTTTCVCMYIHVHTSTCVYIYMRVYMYTYVYIRIYIHTYIIYVYTYVHTYIYHICTYIYAYIYIFSCRLQISAPSTLIISSKWLKWGGYEAVARVRIRKETQFSWRELRYNQMADGGGAGRAEQRDYVMK